MPYNFNFNKGICKNKFFDISKDTGYSKWLLFQ